MMQAESQTKHSRSRRQLYQPNPSLGPCSYNLFNAFLRFSAPVRPLAAVRLTAFVPAAAVSADATGAATFESATPSGAGDVKRSFSEAFVGPFSSVLADTVEDALFDGERLFPDDEDVRVVVGVLLDADADTELLNSAGRT